MPIYAYKCSTCGHEQDVLQKMSDPRLTVCPECGQSTYTKQVTAAGFQLKGSGWYVTDFRDNGTKPPATGVSHTPNSHAASHSTGNGDSAGHASSAASPSEGKPAAKSEAPKAAPSAASGTPSASPT